MRVHERKLRERGRMNTKVECTFVEEIYERNTGRVDKNYYLEIPRFLLVLNKLCCARLKRLVKMAAV